MNRTIDFGSVLGLKGEKGEQGPPGEPARTEDPTFTGSFSHNRLSGSINGEYSFACGYRTEASGKCTHSEGYATKASKEKAHAEGSYTTASGETSHAEGNNSIASGFGSHAEGNNSIASGFASHAEGNGTTASGDSSHTSGSYTEASGEDAFAGGLGTVATNYSSMAIGRYNRAMENSEHYRDQKGDVFVIGIGSQQFSPANALRVTYAGEVLGLRAFLSSGADYAEYIYQWEDGNPNNEDRVGYFVTVAEQKIRIAQDGDYIAGIVSGAPSIVGSGDEDWLGRYERDEFNRIVMEDMPEVTEKRDENGKVIFDKITKKPIFIETGKIIPKGRMKQVSNYDPAKKYISRMERPEWDYIGMLGVISVRDDGTCIPGKFCKCGKGGVATLCETRYFDTFMVIERVNTNVVKVILK